MTIHLPVDLERELTEAAREEGKTETDLVVEAVEQFLRARRATAKVAIPDYARRLGPLAKPAQGSATPPDA